MIIFGDPNQGFGYAELWPVTCASVLVVLLGIGMIVWTARLLRVAARPALIVLACQVATAGAVLLLIGPFFMAPDGLVYDREAVDFAESLGGESEARLTAGKEGWPALLGLIYATIGRAPLVGFLVNGVVTALSSVFVAKTAVCIFGAVSNTRLLAAYLLSPLIVVLGPSLLREALCWLGTAMLCCGFAMVMRKQRPGMATAIVGLVILVTVRTSLGVLMVGAVTVVGLVIASWARGMRLTAVTLVGVGAAAATVLSIPVLGSLGVGEEGLRENRLYLSDATTGFPAGDLGSGPLGLLMTAVGMLPRVAFGPFPWEVSAHIVWLWVLANTVFWFVILYATGRRVRRLADRSLALIFIGGAAIVLLGLSLTLTNYGIVVRMRGMPIMMLLPLVVGAVGSRAADTERLFGRRREAALPASTTRSGDLVEVAAGTAGPSSAADRGAAPGDVSGGPLITVKVTGHATRHDDVVPLSRPRRVRKQLTSTPPPRITGIPAVGKTLTADPGVWAPRPVTFTYRWYRAGVRIAGATAKSYRLRAGDVGKAITVCVTGSRPGYPPVSRVSDPVVLHKAVTGGTPAS